MYANITYYSCTFIKEEIMIITFQLKTDVEHGSQRKGLELLFDTIFSSNKKGFDIS